MSDQLIYLDPEVEIFYTYPFHLGFDIIPMGGDWRKENIPKLAEELNSKIREYRWSSLNIEEDKTLPEPIRESKKVLLKGNPVKADRLISTMKKLARNQLIPFPDCDLLGVNETIWYYDWGAGTIDLVFKVSIKSEAGFDHLVVLTEQLKDLTDLASEKPDESFILDFVNEWEQNSRVFVAFLDKRSENGSPIDQKALGAQYPDVPGYFHPALIMKRSSGEGLVLSEEKFRRLLESFSGKQSAEWKYSESLRDYGVDTCVDGFNGSVAVLNQDYRGSMDSLAEKIKWNFRLAYLYYVRLTEFRKALADFTSKTLNSRKKYRPEDTDWVRGKKLEFDLFLDEMSPGTLVVDDSINFHIYNGIANAQKADETVRQIEGQLANLEHYYSNLIGMESKPLEKNDINRMVNEARKVVDQMSTSTKELRDERAEGKGGIELTEKQKLDYKKFEYQCKDKVHIPGKIPVNRSNSIEVNANEIKMPDSLFILFLRLVAELKKGEGGWVNKHTLKSEGVIQDAFRYQIYSNLRIQLAGSLREKNGRNFIQSNGLKQYRISTHPDFITYDKNKLLNHEDPRIKDIATKLP